MITYESINERGRRLCALIEKELSWQGEAIVFAGALGICVRKVLPLLRDKHADPAVVCVDATGRWVIPVVSGHVGGANDLARSIARITGGQAVVTTQSDNLGLWSLDTLARQYAWKQRPLGHEEMNRAIASFVNGEPTALVLEYEDSGTLYMEETLPEHVTLFKTYDDFLRESERFALLLLVSPRLHSDHDTLTLHFCPPTLHLGMGCQRLAPAAIASRLIREVEAQGFAPESITTVSTIELKRHEPLLAELLRQLPWAKECIYAPADVADISVPNPSQKVRDTTGCWGVAEACALRSAGGELVIEKTKGEQDGSHYTFALATPQAKGGHIEIVGAGPGDPDLVSVRGRRFLERADLILYAGSLVPRALTECAKEGAVVRNSATMSLEEQWALMKRHYDRGHLVVRLHTGDPCIYGAIQEQMALMDEAHVSYHITPGISSFLAAAAELRSQFTIPERCQTIILTRGEGRTPMPERERLQDLARHGATMCIFLSATLAREVQAQLLDGGYDPSTPVAVCHKLTWPSQRLWRGRLDELADIVESNELTLTTMIVVGEAIDNREGLSRLYDGHFSHIFRQGKD